jgi:hypothetical protein
MLNKEMEEWKATSLTPGEEVLVGFLTMKLRGLQCCGQQGRALDYVQPPLY